MPQITSTPSHLERDGGTRLPLFSSHAGRLAGGAISLAAAALLGLMVTVASSVAAQEDDKSVDTAAATPALYEGVEEEGRFLGDPEAPVDLVVYSDYQCSFCKLFDERDLPPIIQNFVESGDVRVEWRPLPILSDRAGLSLESPENESVQAAEAALCAADQNMFWPYSEALFVAQGDVNSGVYADDMLKSTAADLDLETETFNDCLDSGEKQDEVIEFREEAIELGVTGTPTFFIKDQLISYTQAGYDRLEEQLNAALDGEPVEN